MALARSSADHLGDTASNVGHIGEAAKAGIVRSEAADLEDEMLDAGLQDAHDSRSHFADLIILFHPSAYVARMLSRQRWEKEGK